MWHVDEVVKAVGGEALRIERETFAAVSTDSRTIGMGDLFIPLTGPNFDGHLFIGEAYRASQGGTLIEKGREEVYKDAPGTVILVDDTTQALLDLARWKRERLGATCIAITGSNGKTTTKEILVDMLKRSFSVANNEKNYNNLIGVSKSILAIEGEPQFCVFELGTNAPGEIKRLARTVQPDASLITNINPSHLEGLGDIEGVLNEKLDLFYHTKEGGKVFVNADDPYILPRYRDARDTLRTACVFGIEQETPFHLTVDKDLGWQGSDITLAFPDRKVSARTPLLGRHNLYNILAASALAHSAGLGADEIKAAVEGFGAFTMRFTPVKSTRGFIVVNDTYNANPASVEWAVRTLMDLPCRGKRVVILGDMRELGDKTAYYHRELGRFLKAAAVPVVILTGESVKETFGELGGERAILFEDRQRLIDYARGTITPDDIVLVKGSRLAHMEEIVEALI